VPFGEQRQREVGQLPPVPGDSRDSRLSAPSEAPRLPFLTSSQNLPHCSLREINTKAALVRRICIADDTRILPGDEGHSDSDFFLIFLDDRLQQGEKLFFLLGIVLHIVYVPADLPHQFDVVHECPLPNGKFTRVVVGAEYGNLCMVSGSESPRWNQSKAPKIGLMNRECGRRPLASASASVAPLAGGSVLWQP
jgi:hypothetical protein